MYMCVHVAPITKYSVHVCTYIILALYMCIHPSVWLQVRLEEKQRAKRRKREAAAAKAAQAAAAGDHEEATRLEREATYSPMWFQKEYDSVTNTMMHVYKGGYWEGKYSGNWGAEFPEIF